MTMREPYQSTLEQASKEDLERFGFEYDPTIPDLDVYTFVEDYNTITVVKGCNKENIVDGTVDI